MGFCGLVVCRVHHLVEFYIAQIKSYKLRWSARKITQKYYIRNILLKKISTFLIYIVLKLIMIWSFTLPCQPKKQ